MAVVQGIREKVHLPIYDSLTVEPGKQLRDVESSSTLKFFINVQGKTKLETNLQSASLLPHYNTFEARAMRVVISDLPPEFSDDVDVSDEEFDVLAENDDGDSVGISVSSGTDGGAPVASLEGETGFEEDNLLTADVEMSLDRAMELLRQARESTDKEVSLDLDDEAVTLFKGETEMDDDEIAAADAKGAAVVLSVDDLEDLVQSDEKESPPLEQVRPNDGAGNLISKIIFNTVTTFFVGEKVMIEMPTWNFPSGAGAFSFGGRNITHGEPSPLATFRFAEPIFIDKQQNFRVEIEIPDADVLKDIQKIYGPLFIWVVLDGYMTRGVQ